MTTASNPTVRMIKSFTACPETLTNLSQLTDVAIIALQSFCGELAAAPDEVTKTKKRKVQRNARVSELISANPSAAIHLP